MASTVFNKTEAVLLPLLDELRRLEPIFHTAEFGVSARELARRLSPDYWEVGASGRRYSRDFILSHLYTQPPRTADDLGWQSWDHALRSLGPETFLLTYVLRQGERLTRRATLWQRSGEDWRLLYHQGTVVQVEEDDVAPAPAGATTHHSSAAS